MSPRRHLGAHLARLAPIASLLLPVLACSSSPLKSAGTACAADSDCAAGLSCLDIIGTVSDGGCASAVKACSKTCALDSDCAPLGASYKCFAACDGTKSCGATQ
jgi:hypothetical protein